MLGLRCKGCNECLSNIEVRLFDHMDGVCYNCCMSSMEEYDFVSDKVYENDLLSLYFDINSQNSEDY